MGNLDFNADSVEITNERKVIPVGTYNVAILESEIRETRAGTGRLLALVFEITDEGSCKGLRIWEYVNFENPNEKAQQIGRQTLKRICSALGMKSISDSSELIGKRLAVETKVQPSEQYGDSAKVRKYMQPVPAEALVSEAQAPNADDSPW